jgi:hypothetical protein
MEAKIKAFWKKRSLEEARGSELSEIEKSTQPSHSQHTKPSTETK